MKHSSTKSTRGLANSLAIAFAFTGTLLGTSALRAAETQAPAGAQAEAYIQAYSAGREAVRTRHYEEARVEWERAIKLAATPKEKAQAQTALASVFINLRKYEEAEALIEELRKTPKDVRPVVAPYGLLAQLYLAQGKMKEAGEATKQMFETNPESFPDVKFNADGSVAPVYVTNLQQFLYGPLIGDISNKSIAQIQAALEGVAKDPKTPDFKRQQAKIYVGNLLLTQGETEKARAFYLDINVDNLPGDAAQIDLLTRIGDTYAADKDWKPAIKFYDQALALPGVAPIYLTITKAKRDTAQVKQDAVEKRAQQDAATQPAK